jgi:4-carboxymuconolactone decarboxylase
VEHDRYLIDLVVLAVLGRRQELGQRIDQALAAGCCAVDLREALLMVLPYGGFPRALSALQELSRRVAPEAEPSPTAAVDLRARGETVFRAVYGDQADQVLAGLAAAEPALPEWILCDAYGKVIGRPGLSLSDREVLGVALLTALDQPVQLQGHIRGGMRVGAAPERLAAAVHRAARQVPEAAAARALERLRREIPGAATDQ